MRGQEEQASSSGSAQRLQEGGREGQDLERAALDALDLMRRPMAILKKL
jgi:hypothetical protein